MLAPASHLLRKYEPRRNFVVEILTYREYVPVSALRPPSLTAARYKSSQALTRQNRTCTPKWAERPAKGLRSRMVATEPALKASLLPKLSSFR